MSLVVHAFDFANELLSDAENARDCVWVFGVKRAHIDATTKPDAADCTDVVSGLQVVRDKALLRQGVESLDKLPQECLPAPSPDCACHLPAPTDERPCVDVVGVTGAAHIVTTRNTDATNATAM